MRLSTKNAERCIRGEWGCAGRRVRVAGKADSRDCDRGFVVAAEALTHLTRSIPPEPVALTPRAYPPYAQTQQTPRPRRRYFFMFISSKSITENL